MQRVSLCAAGHEGTPNHCLSVSALGKGNTDLKSTVAHPFRLLCPLFYGHAVYCDFC